MFIFQSKNSFLWCAGYSPFRTCEFDIMYNEGISVAGDMLDTGTELGVVGKSGNSYSYAGEKLGVGRENAKATLREHPEMLAQIREACIKTWVEREKQDPRIGVTPPPAGEEEDEAPPEE
jgi:recombination protein RecA